jgi:nucleoside-diphosphate-sugar epimerase
MRRSVSSVNYREALPRMLADLVMVYLSMATAVGVSVSYQMLRRSPSQPIRLDDYLTSGETSLLWLLGPIFILVFLLMGIYTHGRRKKPKEKVWLAVRATLLAFLIILVTHYALLGGDLLSRSVVIPFAILASGCLSLSRALRVWVENYTRTANPADSRARPVLVLGGAGYIGSVLVHRLLERGNKVRILDSLLYGVDPIADVLNHPNLELIVGDCRNIADVIAGIRGADTVIHLAAIVGDPACEVDPQTTLEVNYAATRMLIEVAKGYGVRRFIFASSCSVYGETDEEMTEQSAVNPISNYARTKVESENALLAAQSDSFHPTILRFATVFGLGYRPRFDLVVNLLSAKAYQEGVVTVYNGEQWRPFIHVRDVAEGILTVLDSPIGRVGGEIFNVGDSRLNHTLTEVTEKIVRLLPHTRVDRVENHDKRNYRVNFDKIRGLGFTSNYDLEDGIHEMVSGLRDRTIADYTEARYHNERFIKTAGVQPNKSELDAQIMAVFANNPVKKLAVHVQ